MPPNCKALVNLARKEDIPPVMATATLPPPPRKTANPAPARPSDSIRRTCSIDVSWPGGQEGERLFTARVRDYRTPAGGGPGSVLDAAEFIATMGEDKTISSIAATPSPRGIEQLVGIRAGNHLRLAMKELMPELIAQGAPIYLALDDLSGTSLVSLAAWAQWDEGWLERLRAQFGAGEMEAMMAHRVNICWGLAEGNTGVSQQGDSRSFAQADAGDLRNPADPQGWHALPDFDGPSFRRARRIDVTRDGSSGLIRVAASFQDSTTRKDGGRLAIHEYDLALTCDPGTLEILTLQAIPHILPYPECPGAVHNTQRLVGSRIGDIREEVLAQLRKTEGCTHLNDALRALAEVPKLAGYLTA